jgi:hypothetical protein
MSNVFIYPKVSIRRVKRASIKCAALLTIILIEVSSESREMMMVMITIIIFSILGMKGSYAMFECTRRVTAEECECADDLLISAVAWVFYLSLEGHTTRRTRNFRIRLALNLVYIGISSFE